MAEDNDTSTNALVTPVIRGLRLLEYIAQGGNTQNLSEVGRLIDVNRVTVMRLLATLEHEGMIEKLPGGGHQVGLRYLTMSATALAGHDLVAAGRRVVRDLCQTLGLAAYLSLPDGQDIVYVVREMPPAGLVSLITIGSRVAAHRAAPGQAILAARRAADGSVVSRLALSEDISPEKLAAQLDDITRSGVAWSHSGLEQGISACAAAVLGPDGQPVAALSVAGPSARFDDPSVQAQVGQKIKQSVRQLSSISNISSVQ